MDSYRLRNRLRGLVGLVCRLIGHARSDDNYRYGGAKYVRCSRCRNWRAA